MLGIFSINYLNLLIIGLVIFSRLELRLLGINHLFVVPLFCILQAKEVFQRTAIIWRRQ